MGAAKRGGRWNSPGRPVVYLADHPALAVLEVRVHLDLDLDLLPADYVLLRVTLPVPLDAGSGATETARATGDEWLGEATTPVLRVPSVLVPEAWNLLLNPRHAAAQQAQIEAILPFAFDPRLLAR